jgi:hypothetical protein
MTLLSGEKAKSLFAMISQIRKATAPPARAMVVSHNADRFVSLSLQVLFDSFKFLFGNLSFGIASF